MRLYGTPTRRTRDALSGSKYHSSIRGAAQCASYGAKYSRARSACTGNVTRTRDALSGYTIAQFVEAQCAWRHSAEARVRVCIEVPGHARHFRSTGALGQLHDSSSAHLTFNINVWSNFDIIRNFNFVDQCLERLRLDSLRLEEQRSSWSHGRLRSLRLGEQGQSSSGAATICRNASGIRSAVLDSRSYHTRCETARDPREPMRFARPVRSLLSDPMKKGIPHRRRRSLRRKGNPRQFPTAMVLSGTEYHARCETTM